jgi:hypothetical protein
VSGPPTLPTPAPKPTTDRRVVHVDEAKLFVKSLETAIEQTRLTAGGYSAFLHLTNGTKLQVEVVP